MIEPLWDIYPYGHSGNMISRPGMTLTWNAENLLQEVRDDQSPFDLIESYLYDANGQRAVKTDANGVETHYVNKWYEVRRESGQPDVETVHYWFGGQAVATDEGGTLRFMHADHLGSSSIATDVSGNAVAGSTYFPYGEHRSSSGAFGTDRDFTGQRLDSGTGLHFYNARYYDSALGRFISPDSIVPDFYDPKAWNRYSYVINNPLRYDDPTGHCYTTDCWAEPHPSTVPDRGGIRTEEVWIGSWRVTREIIPVINIVNGQRPDGKGRILPSEKDIVTVPYAISGGAGSAGHAIAGIFGDAESRSFSNPGSDTIIIQERHINDIGVWFEEVYHKVEQDEYWPVLSHLGWTAAYLIENLRHGYHGNSFETRAWEARDYALSPDFNLIYSFGYTHKYKLQVVVGPLPAW